MTEEEQIQALTKALVNAAAPQESASFEDVLRLMADQPTRGKSNPLGSGVGEAWALAQFVTPVAMAIGTWVVKDILAKTVADVVTAKLKPLAQALLDKVLKRNPGTSATLSDADIQTLQAAIEEIARKRGASHERIQQLNDGVRRLITET